MDEDSLIHNRPKKEGVKMDELVRTVSQKTGLSDDKSRMAIQAVTDYLKKKLPGPISGQIDTVLQGGSISDAARGVSGIMGRK